jgi:PKD repeat protein
MKKKTLLLVLLLATAVFLPLIAIRAQGDVDAGPDQQVYTGQTTMFNGTTTENATSIVQVTWDFGDNSTAVNGTSPELLNATHTYTASGVYNATLTVKFDSALNKTETDTAIITVSENQPPVADAGPDQTVEQESHAGTQVTLNGTATDAVSTRFNFTWSEDDIVLKTEANVTDTVLIYTFNLGTHVVTLNATDEAGNIGSDNVTVTVVDTTPPEINATATPSNLWSPNHKYVEVKANVTAYDICDPSPTITLVSITSNEPDNSIGDGNTVNDIVIVEDFTFNLNAERSGLGCGRSYTIIYEATDMSGNSAMATVTVEVPHNQ